MSESVARVHKHTNTHTQCNLINKKQSMKNVLLMIDKTEQL